MIKLAIDFGSSVTKIYKIGSGIVLAEPTCLALASGSRAVKALGADAKLLIGKTAEYTTIVFPVFEADIVDEEAAAVLLSYFLRKIGLRPSKARRAQVLFNVPCGAEEELLQKYIRLANACGIGSVVFAETPFLAALGQNVPLNEADPVFVIDVGGGCTNIAAFSLDGIIAGVGLGIGGGNLDSQIIDHIAKSFHLKIGLQTSEKLKMTVGSLYANDNDTMVVNGRDLTSGRPRAVSVSSSDIYECVKVFVDRIVRYALMIVAKLPAEVSASVYRNGIYLSGGSARLIGMDDYIAREMQMDVNLADEPQMSVILGGGRTVGNENVLSAVCLRSAE